MLPIADRWFEISRISDDITLLWEPHVTPLMRCNIWHVRGRDRDLMIDTGMGIVSLRDEYELIWQQVLDDAVRSGLISQDTKLLRKMLLGSLNWTVQWFQPSGDLSIDQLAERMLALLIREPLIPSCAR